MTATAHLDRHQIGLVVGVASSGRTDTAALKLRIPRAARVEVGSRSTGYEVGTRRWLPAMLVGDDGEAVARGLEVAEENVVGSGWISASLVATAPVEREVQRGEGRGVVRVSEGSGWCGVRVSVGRRVGSGGC
jgi:hypothetical protein